MKSISILWQTTTKLLKSAAIINYHISTEKVWSRLDLFLPKGFVIYISTNERLIYSWHSDILGFSLLITIDIISDTKTIFLAIAIALSVVFFSQVNKVNEIFKKGQWEHQILVCIY